jgi:uncharacterized protein
MVLAIALGVLLIRHGGRTARPPKAVLPSRVVPGFGEVGFKVTGPGALPAATRTHCALLATTDAQRARGLMNRHDLAGYDAMIFQFSRPTTVPFYMKDTLIPLSIAWFDPTGRFVNGTTMPPCPKTSLTCPTYAAIAPYSVAIEVAAGTLPQLAIGPGAQLAVGEVAGDARRHTPPPYSRLMDLLRTSTTMTRKFNPAPDRPGPRASLPGPQGGEAAYAAV